MCVVLKDPTLKSTVAFSTNVEPWFHDTQVTSAKGQKTSRSRSGGAKGSSRAAPGMSASMNSTDIGSEAVLIDGLLFASISSGLLSRRRTFKCDKLLLYFFRCAASHKVFYSGTST